MIVPNLMVSDLARSIAFYRDVVGLSVDFAMDAERNMIEGGDGSGGVFARLSRDDDLLMLQTVASLAGELESEFNPAQTPKAAGTVYFQGFDPDAVVAKAAPDVVIKAPFVQWYGMREAYLRDPDGHVVCIGRPDGPPPEA